jgi:hypothetical protein
MTTTQPQAQTDLLDEEWLSAPSRRSRLRGFLVVLLAAALVFLGGVEVQRRYGAAPASAPASGPPLLGGSLPAGPTGGGPQASTSGATGSADEAAVIGTVQSVQGDVWTVKDLGGTLHEVTVSSTVRIVRETSVAASDVETGATVDVAGTTDDDGRLAATTITLR